MLIIATPIIAMQEKADNAEILQLALSFKQLLKTSDKTIVDKNIQQKLFLAVYRNNATEVLKLLENGANTNFQNEDGNTVLHVAVALGHVPIVKILLDKGADPTIQCNYGSTPIHHATSLYATGANDTPLVEFIKTLLEKGANINTQDNYGNTALHNALDGAHYPFIKALLKIDNINLNLKNKNGYTALHLATSKIPGLSGRGSLWRPRHDISIKTLLENGADPNIKNKDNKIALDHSASRNMTFLENLDNFSREFIKVKTKIQADKVIERYKDNANLPILVSNLALVLFDHNTSDKFKLIEPYISTVPERLDNLKILKGMADLYKNPSEFWKRRFYLACQYNKPQNIPYMLDQIDIDDKEFKKVLNQAKKNNHKELGRALINWYEKKHILNKPMFQKKTIGTQSGKELKNLKNKNITIPDDANIGHILAYKGTE